MRGKADTQRFMVERVVVMCLRGNGSLKWKLD